MNAVSEESSVLAGGYFYFTLDVYDSLGTAELETDFPGGRGVWRVRAEEDSAPGGPDDNYSVTANLYSAELAFNGWDWDDALLDASADGEYVLLYTLEGAELWLNVLDPGSGAAVQRLELTAGMPEDEREALEDYGIDAAGRKAVRLGRRRGVFHQGAPGLGRRGGLLRRALCAAVHGGDRQIRGGPEHIQYAARRLRLGRRAAVYALCPTQSLALGDGRG